jgi:NADPH:quinone reductase-like Zn-dependent oxidoreductase
MRAIEAKTFSGYDALRQAEYPKPQAAKDKVLIRVTAAGVIEDAGESGLALGSRVMFTGPYGVAENGAWQEWLLVKPEHLALVPQAIDDVVAATLPVDESGQSTRVAFRRCGRARMAGFSLFAQSATVIAAAWRDILPLIVNGSVRPIVERAYPFGQAREALRHLIEDRPFGKVVLAG